VHVATPILPCDFPNLFRLEGRTVDLERIDVARHGPQLWRSIGADPRLWSRIPPGPFENEPAFHDWLADRAQRNDASLCAIIDRSADRRAIGLFFLLNIDTTMGVMEMGLVYGPGLRRKTEGTEAFFLLARYIFELLRYRRLEWRCDSAHAESRRAAHRYGFRLEGVLRQAMWVKGANSDSALYAMLDHEWPDNAVRLRDWLAPANFDADGRQLTRLPLPRDPGPASGTIP
jgi:RimJ/RimL family protein N-acetyltransferase